MAQKDNQQTSDEVVEQVRRIKAALAESMGFDVDRIVDEARRKQKEGSRPVLSPPVRQDT